MPRNTYFSQGTKSEQSLYEDIVIEGLKIYGHDAYYIPRKIVNEDSIFNEDQLSSFGSSYMIEAFVANVDGYEGEGDLLSKFGLEIKDQLTLVIANRRWEQLIGRHVSSDTTLDRAVTRRPMEGDLVYLPFVKGLFEIQFVEAEDPFYQLQNLPTFQLKLELFQYGGEDIDTGVDVIDTYETQFAESQRLALKGPTNGKAYHIGEDISQLIAGIGGSGTRTISGEVKSWDSPNKYLTVYGISGFDGSPSITFTANSNGIIGATSGASYLLDSPGTSLAIDMAQMESVDPDSDNEEFETIGNNFIDFSISNPFGLPNA
jgi:hypothetical protein